MNPVRLFIFAAFLCSCLALECYSGQTAFGVDLGKSTETCKNSNDYCFNATIDKINIKKFGCRSSLECTLANNECISKEFDGYTGVKFCCFFCENFVIQQKKEATHVL
ncbi:unnamed protein product [Cylicocyclus nassatus]|uniref:Uncharacterized protein n=1 Tax=Cylicocyclus nassatus TaxID=53992 RepID=A0AA36LZ24_CYLNA|nr:unnamed protein product [Cylicocyclus nassatus]